MTDDWLPAKKIDAFTATPYAGNAAGVVALSEPLSDGQMQQIAREMNLSETAFVLPDPVGDADYRLRYFTPTTEVPICGHATIATLHHLAAESEKASDGALGPVTLSTRVGVLQAEVVDGVAWTTMDATPELGLWPGDVGDVLDMLGLDEGAIAPGARPVQIGPDVIALEVVDVATLDAIRPRIGAIRDFDTPRLDMLIPFTLTGSASGVSWHQRMFAPNVGIDEDPVTGVATARIANLLVRMRRFLPIPGEPVLRLRARQGDAMGKPGEVDVRLKVAEDGSVSETRIGGRGVVTFEGRIRVPPQP